MNSHRSRWLVTAIVALALGVYGMQSFEGTALAGSTCVTDSDCGTACKTTNGQLAYKCVTATQLGAGFSNRCAWPTVASTTVPVSSAPTNSTRTGLVYVACP